MPANANGAGLDERYAPCKMMKRPKVRSAPRLVALAMMAVWTLTSHALASSSAEVVAKEMPIVNGTAVEPGGALGTVALVRTDSSARLGCSAVLIAPAVVLTAAHCLVERPERPEAVDCWSDCDEAPQEACQGIAGASAESLFVAAGVTGQDDLADMELVPVREFVTHPRYNAFNLCNDIAILALEVPVTAVDPVAVLPADILSDIEPMQPGLAQGYGRQLHPASFERLPQERYVDLLNETSNEIVLIDGRLLETGGKESGVCFGDSGGPLYVQEDGANYVIGLSSQFRPGQICKGGSIYTLVPAYEQWIAQEAPEVAEYWGSGKDAGGGCSAVPGAKPLSPLALLVLLLLLVGSRRLRGGRRGLLVLCVVPLALFVGCADDEAPDLSDESFCTVERDPLGWPLCDGSVERLDLFSADALVREAFDLGDEVWLWETWAVSHREGNGPTSIEPLNPDGEAAAWVLGYRVAADHPVYAPGVDSIYFVDVIGTDRVRADGVRPLVYRDDDFFDGEELWSEDCMPTEPMALLDTRQVVHDAIERYEADVGPLVFEDGVHLGLLQRHPCAAGAAFPFQNEVSIYTFEGTFSAFYDGEGSFLLATGP